MAEEKKAGVRDTDLTIWAFVFFLIAIGCILAAMGLISGRVYERLSVELIPLITDFLNSFAGSLPSWWPPSATLFMILGGGALVFGVIFAILGYGVYTVKPWARILAILVGFLLIPVSGFGIIVLWYFFRTETKERFSEEA
ncbi:MAG: hypothetical protein HWN66_01845 [Candidatus Helarchaeota archaeon]|nr:hypothetical protein [Candidatus Helarchaeota archaeon]